MSGISFPDLSPLDRYKLLRDLKDTTCQRDTFAMDRESHAQWNARVQTGK
jgi:hypothetical protein